MNAYFNSNTNEVHFDSYSDKSPVNTYIGELKYNLTDSDFEGGNYSAILIEADKNLVAMDIDEAWQLVCQAIEQDTDFEWLTTRENVAWEIRINRSVSSAEQLDTLLMMSHYRVRI